MLLTALGKVEMITTNIKVHWVKDILRLHTSETPQVIDLLM